MIPPLTERYCENCEKNSQFLYNHTIGHSECTECGFRFGSNPKSKAELRKIRIKKNLNKRHWIESHVEIWHEIIIDKTKSNDEKIEDLTSLIGAAREMLSGNG